jgi:hypothetical protein
MGQIQYNVFIKSFIQDESIQRIEQISITYLTNKQISLLKY